MMTSGPDERFPKAARLRKRMDYLAVQRNGAKVQSRAFVGLIIFRNDGPTRLGITTSKKLGKAVTRNRTKRLVREAFRRGHLSLPYASDVVVIAKKNAAQLESDVVFDDLAILGRRLMKLVEKNS